MLPPTSLQQALTASSPLQRSSIPSPLNIPTERAPLDGQRSAWGGRRLRGIARATSESFEESSRRSQWAAALPARVQRVFRSVGAPQKIRGKLNKGDRIDRRTDTYFDEFQLRGVESGQPIVVRLNARFDAYLQLIDASTGQELLFGDEITGQNAKGRFTYSSNARMVFTAQAGVDYRIRVTSYDAFKTGKYTLNTRINELTADNFNFFYGHGLVNAATAVAAAAGKALVSDSTNPGSPIPSVNSSDNWGLDLIRAPEVWAAGFTGQGVTVAVLDTGIDYNHPDLANSLWSNADEIAGNGLDDDNNGYIDDVRGWNFISNSNDPLDDTVDGHGSHVAGIIAASRNDMGITGVAHGAKIMPLKVLDRRGSTDTDTGIAAAIRYAVDNGAKVINMSLGGDPGSGVEPELDVALTYARQAGVAVVIAAGNERQVLGSLRSGDPAYWATIRNLALVVGAVDRDRKMYVDSNPAGASPINFVVAPGVDIKSTIVNGDYATYEGTSMATPHVSGVIALMLSANPSLTATAIEAILRATSDPDAIITAL